MTLVLYKKLLVGGCVVTKFEGDQGSHVPQIILYNCIVILVFHPQSQLLSVRSGMAARRSRGLWWVKFIITSDFSLLFLVQMFNLIKSSSNAGLPPQQQLCCYNTFFILYYKFRILCCLFRKKDFVILSLDLSHKCCLFEKNLVGFLS